MLGLISLPYEVLSNIVGHIDFDDIFNLSLSCKALGFLIAEESICRLIVQTKIKHANEALEETVAEIGNNALALRRVAKRREALAAARPFTVATIGFGDAYLYCKGVLCYTVGNRIRILDLHHSGKSEVVINIPHLLDQALPGSRHNTQGLFQILYYSDDILSCIYRPSDLNSTTWLLAFNFKSKKILVSDALESTNKLFVRHNREFLYYGTHTGIGDDGYKEWIIQGYDFKYRHWFYPKIHLSDMLGSEIGSTVCFELHREYFYAVSNQIPLEEYDSNSFYRCVRFPLKFPCGESLETTEDWSMWRRQHQEGPIDDRWTSLRLDVDESTGDLRIAESRKEWKLGSSRSQRTHYITDIIFRGCAETVAATEFVLNTTGPPLLSTPTTTTASPAMASSSGFLSHDIPISLNKSDIRLLWPDTTQNYKHPPSRLPQNIHPGSAGHAIYTLADCCVRYYHTSASTFLDLVNEPVPIDGSSRQRLRLRTGSRRPRRPLPQPCSHSNKTSLCRDASLDIDTALAEIYSEQPIQYWPPDQDPFSPDENVDTLYRLLNPPMHLGNVEGTADERSLVYLTGGLDKPRAIMFIGFDPAITLAGLGNWEGRKADMCQKSTSKEPRTDGRAAWREKSHAGQNSPNGANGIVNLDSKGKGRAKHEPTPNSGLGTSVDGQTSTLDSFSKTATARDWAWEEKAMYQDIGLGFYFGLQRGEKI